MQILKNLYQDKYSKVFENLPFKVKNNLVNYGFSVEKGKYFLYGLN